MLAKKTGRDWSLIVALVDPQYSVKLWTQKTSGQLRVMSQEQVTQMDAGEGAEWTLVRDLDTSGGLRGSEAESLFIARYVVDNAAQLQALYQIKTEPTTLEQTLTDRWIDLLVHRLGSPFIAAWLLFGAMFFLSTEMSTPGVGVPGFLGSLCLVLFFWSQYCNGNANWLEILLFIVGLGFLCVRVVCIARVWHLRRRRYRDDICIAGAGQPDLYHSPDQRGF